MKVELESILQETQKLPALPQVITEILQKIDDPETTPEIFQQVITKDPFITAKTLKLANSAFYGYSREISTISNAVVILGMDTLRSMIIAMSAYNLLNKEVKGYNYQRDDYWKHSLSTAIITRKIAQLREYQNLEICFISGLLHDIGKLLLDRFRYIYLESIEEFSRKNKVPDYLAEKAIIGYNHSDAGAYLANVWKFPQVLTDVINYHHWPLKVNNLNSIYIKVVHVADCMSNIYLKGSSNPVNKIVEREIGVTDQEKEKIIAETTLEMDQFTQELRKE